MLETKLGLGEAPTTTTDRGRSSGSSRANARMLRRRGRLRLRLRLLLWLLLRLALLLRAGLAQGDQRTRGDARANEHGKRRVGANTQHAVHRELAGAQQGQCQRDGNVGRRQL